MFYKQGDTRVVRYESWKRVSTSPANIMAVARRPDGTQILLTPAELDGGTNPITQGIYEVSVTFDQDGEWLVLFDTLIQGQRRPQIKSLTVNTPVMLSIEKISSAEEIEQYLAGIHGQNSWEDLSLLGDPVKGAPYK